jgi:hypothetical protein
MGGTILPPTQREIESENRHLKDKLDQVYLSISRIVNGRIRPEKVTLGRLKEIMEYIYPTKLATKELSECQEYQDFMEANDAQWK